MVRTLLIISGVLLFTGFLSGCGKPVDFNMNTTHPSSMK